MQLTSLTLRSTADRFGEALAARGHGLRFSTRLDVWAQIVTGKKYSAAHSRADELGAIPAVPIKAERIQELLRKRNRNVSLGDASDIFTHAIGDDLLEVSEYMYQLLGLVRLNPGYCLTQRLSDPLGLGVIDAGHPGYHLVSQLCPFSGSEYERKWLRGSAELVASTVNGLAGYSSREYTDILVANLRKSFEREDDVFAEFARSRLEPLSHALAAQMLAELHDTPVTEWEDLDFDEVRDSMGHFLEREVRKADGEQGRWLKADCSLGDAVTDHLAARVRETLRYFSQQALVGGDEDDYADSLALTVRQSIGRIVR
jgi:hypothetical protein